ncbi:MAG TPA: sugar phosphate isomerase/epimerase [Actinomycetota bacterium]|nr:sugar phosphate isomerase/epimerase [Actinomycetota bacterium]
MPLADAFGLIADAGFSGIEVMVTKDPDTRDARRLRELAEDLGLRIEALHAPFLLVTRRVWGANPIGKIRRAVQLAEEVGAPLVVAHPPFRWQSGYRRWLREELSVFAEATPVVVGIENMFPVHVRGRQMAFHSVTAPADLDGFDHVVLDTSHAAVSGLDLLETLDALRGRIAHVHLSDNPGKGWDSHLPLGEGVLPLDPFLEDLSSSGYTGAVSLELDLRRHQGDPEALREALTRNREFCAARLPQVA